MVRFDYTPEKCIMMKGEDVMTTRIDTLELAERLQSDPSNRL